MLRLKYMRHEKGLSLRELADIAHVDKSVICRAEKWGDHLGDTHLQRLSKALDWDGDCHALLQDVEIKESI